MADPAYIRNLRAITRAEPQFMHIEALERELYSSDNDRATVVMFGSFVETHLERLVTSKMRSGLSSTDRRRLFEGDGPLSTFSSKILAAYAFNIRSSAQLLVSIWTFCEFFEMNLLIRGYLLASGPLRSERYPMNSRWLTCQGARSPMAI
jgi:hypothetical protein